MSLQFFFAPGINISLGQIKLKEIHMQAEVDSRRRIAMCMSAAPSKYESVLNNVIPCQAIYSKEFEHGTLYGLHMKGAKSDAALDKRICFLDGMLSDCSPEKHTHFTSICNTPSLSGRRLPMEHMVRTCISRLCFHLSMLEGRDWSHCKE